jgi:VanZ family protein
LPPGRHPLFLACLLGFCSSVCIETYQLFCHDRVPSATDIVMNVAGTALGVWLALAVDRVFEFWSIQIRRLST